MAGVAEQISHVRDYCGFFVIFEKSITDYIDIFAHNSAAVASA